MRFDLAFIDYSFRFAKRAFNFIDRHHGRLHRNPDIGFDVMNQIFGRCGAEIFTKIIGIAANFHDDVQFVQSTITADFNVIMRRQAVVFQDDFFDLRREHVNAANNQHVIGTPGQFFHAPVGPRRAGKQAGKIAGAITNNREGFL